MKSEHEESLKKAFNEAKVRALVDSRGSSDQPSLQIEAGVEHSKELASLRQQSQSFADQLKSAHQTELESIVATHQDTLTTQVSSLEKQIANLKLELSATQDTLSKTKTALATATSQIEALQAQLDQARKDAEAAKTAAASDKEAAVEDLKRQVANKQREYDDLDVRKRCLSIFRVMTNVSLRIRVPSRPHRRRSVNSSPMFNLIINRSAKRPRRARSRHWRTSNDRMTKLSAS